MDSILRSTYERNKEKSYGNVDDVGMEEQAEFDCYVPFSLTNIDMNS